MERKTENHSKFKNHTITTEPHLTVRFLLLHFPMGNRLQQFILKTIGVYINALSYLYPKEAVRLAEKYISEPRKES